MRLQTMESLVSPPKPRRMISVPMPQRAPRPCEPHVQPPSQYTPGKSVTLQGSQISPFFLSPAYTVANPTLATWGGAEMTGGVPILQEFPRNQVTPPFGGTPSRVCGPVGGDFEQQLIDRAVGDLPSVFSEVFSMQQGQTNEIQRLQGRIQDLNEKLAEGEDSREEVKMELKSVSSRIYLIGESIADGHKACKQFSNEMNEMVKEEYQLQRKVGRAEDEKEAEIKFLNKERNRKLEFEATVKSHEELHTTTGRDILETTRRLTELRTQKACLEVDTAGGDMVRSGGLETELLADIDQLKRKVKEATDERNKMENEVVDRKQQQKQLEQSIQVMHKRNAAQLTRLRRQLKDVQQRNRHWQNQISQLEGKIAEARAQLANS